MTDILTGAFTGGRKTFTYSSARYYEESKVNYSRHRTNRWNKQTKDLTDMMANDAGGCTANPEKMKEWVTHYLATCRDLMAHRSGRGYKKLRFLRFCKKKSTVSKMCDGVAPPKDGKLYCIGFGDWSGGHASPISRRCAGPIQDIKRELFSRDNVLMKHVDEFRTSKTHNITRLPLVNMKVWAENKTQNKYIIKSDSLDTLVMTHTTTKRVLKKVHKVLHCKTSDGKCPEGCRETTVDRDVNASRNILELFRLEIMGLARPPQFSRSPKPMNALNHSNGHATKVANGRDVTFIAPVGGRRSSISDSDTADT
jgi:hypothetical protein